MSELVPEPRPKPAVPMKPVSINSNLLGYIGIDTIIEQMRKKTMKTGFDFNIMVVGQSGLGKSTLVNTLFKSQVSRKASSWNREEKIPKTVEIKAIGHVIEEGGVKMKLTVIDTPGFGDQINNENCWEPIEKYINEQYEKFLKEEVNIARKKRIPDTRVHCCLYFISPTGHSRRACPSLSWEVTRSTKWMASGSSAEKLPGGSLKWKTSTTVSLPCFETLSSEPTSRTSRK
uniref:Septin-type G domain-containing protein n=1 Tax=Rousettus aegyptiacus TaxID=9407 RepID=A0A7J8JLB0_ROUAE|nr:hypothetical protein HJG63_017377 [Rousettus aegyptiacus]